jgi:hypothetical protein
MRLPLIQSQHGNLAFCSPSLIGAKNQRYTGANEL